MKIVSSKWGPLMYEINGSGKLTELEFTTHEPTEEAPEWLRDLMTRVEKTGFQEADRAYVEMNGTPFQQEVWDALLTIPYGETRTYKQIAEQIGRPKAVRAVGQALNRNPLPILFPCHRVIGSSGKLIGFAGGLSEKQRLLEFEMKK
ncbi:methylated-DNA--[protein]-cysteine S-methyltransferase [Exiguobacterium profundum]|uniref:methylated-DNA--[protein]-cysteine S-methyltransferase n=1 Tax=Exiguobacterium TaxID=33986 RepID=UPI0012EFF1F4|nr:MULTISPECIES: methylated-DNA--[protein]-cysteine S-methyltransferase [Exiguobacterium]QPI67076.1 methylated-DNA--[protein]-cysteine S-methyltransferase [Exiguobacterium sp. PBE]MCT4798567.1 methylated-DNA--[protein]-cysteine S-methyltransferase [Exiguobacterium profundum]MCV9898507.1 methylated-DNA--[protein]-cysteine S-methyltransferase [Exiguobacterium sp. N5]VXB85865.1 Methylated-DNA--protein-cysteine methyltransferase [Exiguobacterium sp. 8A]VXC12282.1 Methylated-DNA--protein-cysteine m